MNASVKKVIVRCLAASAFITVGFAGQSVKFSDEKVSFHANAANAQVAKKKKDKRSLESPGASYSRKMLRVTDLISPENPQDKPNFTKALAEAKKIENSCDKCNAFEKGQLYFNLAFIYISQDKEKEALSYYKKVVAQSPKIPWGTELNARYAIAQLAFNQGDYNEALKQLRFWMAYQDVIKPNAYYMEGRICYDKGDVKCALDKVKLAVKMRENEGKIAQESWYQLLNGIYVDREDYKSALPVLHKLVKNYPRIAYWKQMGQIYGALNQDKNRLSSFDALRVMNGLKSESDLLNLSYMYLGAEAPYMAAKVISKGINDGAIKKTTKNYETLGAAYFQAKEYDDAIDAYTKAASSAANGEHYAKITALHLRNNDYKKTVEFGKRALNKGGLKNSGAVHFDMGVAYFNQKQFDSAISSFEKASKSKTVRSPAQAWLAHTKNSKKKYTEIRREVKRIRDELSQRDAAQEDV